MLLRGIAQRRKKNLTAGTFTPIKYKQNRGKLRDNAFMNWVRKVINMRQSVKTKRIKGKNK
jgi:hypothetical protein